MGYTLGNPGKNPPKGERRRTGSRITIEFDDITFDEIKKRAIREKSSFAEQVRTLVEWGLNSEQETECPKKRAKALALSKSLAMTR